MGGDFPAPDAATPFAHALQGAMNAPVFVRRAEPIRFAHDFQAHFSVRAGLSPPRQADHPFRPGEIAKHRRLEAAGDRRQSGRLAGADLDEGMSAGGEHPPKVGDDRAVGVEAVGTAVKRHMGIVAGNLNRQARNFVADDIGRIGDEQVESAGKSRRPVADDEGGTAGEAEPFGVRPRRPSRSFREVDADAGRLRQLGEEGEENRPRSGAEIEEAEGGSPPPVAIERSERRLDHRLGVGSRHQRLGRQRERERPEILGAEDAGNRLAGDPPRNQPLGRRDRGGVGRLVGKEDEAVRLAAKRVSDEKPGVELGGAVAGAFGEGGAQPRREPPLQPAGRLAGGGRRGSRRPGPQTAASSAASRLAGWSVISASIRSSSACPASTSSSL